MDTQIRLDGGDGYPYSLCYISTPTTWECVDGLGDDYVAESARVYKNNGDLGDTPSSYQVEAVMHDDLADAHYTKVATKYRLLRQEGLTNYTRVRSDVRKSYERIGEILRDHTPPTYEDIVVGREIKKDCIKRHEFFLKNGTFMGCDERLGFGTFTSGCLDNYT